MSRPQPHNSHTNGQGMPQSVHGMQIGGTPQVHYGAPGMMQGMQGGAPMPMGMSSLFQPVVGSGVSPYGLEYPVQVNEMGMGSAFPVNEYLASMGAGGVQMHNAFLGAQSSPRGSNSTSNGASEASGGTRKRKRDADDRNSSPTTQNGNMLPPAASLIDNLGSGSAVADSAALDEVSLAHLRASQAAAAAAAAAAATPVYHHQQHSHHQHLQNMQAAAADMQRRNSEQLLASAHAAHAASAMAFASAEDEPKAKRKKREPTEESIAQNQWRKQHWDTFRRIARSKDSPCCKNKCASGAIKNHEAAVKQLFKDLSKMEEGARAMAVRLALRCNNTNQTMYMKPFGKVCRTTMDALLGLSTGASADIRRDMKARKFALRSTGTPARRSVKAPTPRRRKKASVKSKKKKVDEGSSYATKGAVEEVRVMLKLVVAEGAAVDMPRIAENITVLSGEWTVTGLWRRYCQYVRLKDKANLVCSMETFRKLFRDYFHSQYILLKEAEKALWVHDNPYDPAAEKVARRLPGAWKEWLAAAEWEQRASQPHVYARAAEIKKTGAAVEPPVPPAPVRHGHLTRAAVRAAAAATGAPDSPSGTEPGLVVVAATAPAQAGGSDVNSPNATSPPVTVPASIPATAAFPAINADMPPVVHGKIASAAAASAAASVGDVAGGLAPPSPPDLAMLAPGEPNPLTVVVEEPSDFSFLGMMSPTDAAGYSPSRSSPLLGDLDP